MQRAEREEIDGRESFNGAPDRTTKSKLADIKSLVRAAVSQKLTLLFSPTLQKKSAQNKRRKILSDTRTYLKSEDNTDESDE